MKHLRFILTVIILFFFLLCYSQTRRAIVIGLGEQKDVGWGKINGDKDIPYIISMLKMARFNEKNIKSLINKSATKEKIVFAFNELIELCGSGDIVYIHFSGHGQRVTDIDGDEDDGWDESWIPYDAYRDYCIKDRGDKHLLDDEIYKFLVEIKKKIGDNGKILVVADACHSGGSSFGYKSFSLYSSTIEHKMFSENVTIRGISIPFVIPNKNVSKKTKKPEQWLTLSACKSFQVNQELANPKVGILSYALYTISKKGSVEMWKIEEFIKQHKGPYPQTPILTGEIDKYNLSDVLK